MWRRELASFHSSQKVLPLFPVFLQGEDVSKARTDPTQPDEIATNTHARLKTERLAKNRFNSLLVSIELPASVTNANCWQQY
jgi:hypothetical protein